MNLLPLLFGVAGASAGAGAAAAAALTHNRKCFLDSIRMPYLPW